MAVSETKLVLPPYTKQHTDPEKQIAELAAGVFDQHVITQTLDQGLFRSWRCHRPGTWNYGFDVTTTPGHLIVTGDLGDLILEREADMIPWASRAIDSISYFAEKVPHCIKTREYSWSRAVDWVREEWEERIRDAADEGDQEQIDKLLEWWDDWDDLDGAGFSDGHDREWLYDQLTDTSILKHGLTDGSDFPSFDAYTAEFLWVREALKWFLVNLPKPEIEKCQDSKPTA